VGLGEWSPTTIAAVIADLRDPPAQKTRARGYEITASGVMWSEDGTGFREGGRKRELLVIQDEHARFKLGNRLSDGPADEEAVCQNLRRAFAKHGAPLVLKHDGDSIFHGHRIQQLLTEHQVVELTGPPGYPPYNGKQERSMRDVKSYERAMRRHGVQASLRERLVSTMQDLNEDRPRPVLGGRTAREAFEEDRVPLPDRVIFREEVTQTEKALRARARSRSELGSARRRAVELVLLRYGLLREWRDVSTISPEKRRTE
jgi:transposase InsO family protein